jgi:hypothetical protein
VDVRSGGLLWGGAWRLATLLRERRKGRGYFNTWPPVVVEFADRVGQDPEPMRLPPAPAAISRMEETLGWLRWLKAEHAKLVWARAEGTPWKQICWRFGIARATAHRRWRYGLSVMAYQLNGQRLITKRSRRFAPVYVVQREHTATSQFTG